MFRNTHVFSWVLAVSLLTLAGVNPSSRARAQAAPETDSASAARADIAKTLGFVPRFFQKMADAAVGGMWTEMKGLQMNPNSALSGKSKELIGLGVAARCPAATAATPTPSSPS